MMNSADYLIIIPRALGLDLDLPPYLHENLPTERILEQEIAILQPPAEIPFDKLLMKLLSS
jgi:hypothetical protein